MNRKQRRANKKSRRIALKRTQKHAKKIALKCGKTKAEADIEASLLPLVFRNELWHPETLLGQSVENLSKGFSS